MSRSPLFSLLFQGPHVENYCATSPQNCPIPLLFQEKAPSILSLNLS